MLGHFERLEEILSALNVYGMIVCVVPVEVRDALLQSKEIVNCTDDNIHSGRVPSLSSKVVLKLCVVALTEKLEKSKQTLGEEVVGKNLAKNCRAGRG